MNDFMSIVFKSFADNPDVIKAATRYIAAQTEAIKPREPEWREIWFMCSDRTIRLPIPNMHTGVSNADFFLVLRAIHHTELNIGYIFAAIGQYSVGDEPSFAGRDEWRLAWQRDNLNSPYAPYTYRHVMFGYYRDVLTKAAELWAEWWADFQTKSVIDEP